VRSETQREILARQEASFNTAINEAKTEVAAYEKELAKIKEQRNLRETTLSTLETLSKKGLTTQQRLMDSQILLASADRDAQCAIANIRSRQVDRAERDLAVLPSSAEWQSRGLQTIDEQIAKLQVTIDGASRGWPNLGLPSRLARAAARYEIMRRHGRGAAYHSAGETTAAAGDVVRVSARPYQLGSGGTAVDSLQDFVGLSPRRASRCRWDRGEQNNVEVIGCI
jgi:polysaccharide export outer membrane protein